MSSGKWRPSCLGFNVLSRGELYPLVENKDAVGPAPTFERSTVLSSTKGATYIGGLIVIIYFSLQCQPAVEVSYKCPDEQSQSQAKQLCFNMKQPPFTDCHNVASHSELYEWCVIRVCGAMDAGKSESEIKAIRCNFFQEYSRECAEEGVPIQWRKPDLCRKYIH